MVISIVLFQFILYIYINLHTCSAFYLYLNCNGLFLGRFLSSVSAYMLYRNCKIEVYYRSEKKKKNKYNTSIYFSAGDVDPYGCTARRLHSRFIVSKQSPTYFITGAIVLIQTVLKSSVPKSRNAVLIRSVVADY